MRREGKYLARNRGFKPTAKFIGPLRGGRKRARKVLGNGKLEPSPSCRWGDFSNKSSYPGPHSSLYRTTSPKRWIPHFPFPTPYSPFLTIRIFPTGGKARCGSSPGLRRLC